MRQKREISPAQTASAEDFFRLVPAPIRGIISTIRAEKDEGLRSVPSTALIDKSVILTSGKRAALLDFASTLVDENLTGRSDMCIQFALLIDLSLRHLGFASRAVSGEAAYFSVDGQELFRWNHAWVRIGAEVIDGNTDSIDENPMVPSLMQIPPYWGPIKGIPLRRLVEEGVPEDDADVSNIWWPDMKSWLEGTFSLL